MAKNCCPSNSSSSGRLRQQPSVAKNCWSSSSLSSGRIRQEPSKLKSRAQVARELPPSPQGRLRHQRPRSAGYDCVNNATVREGRVWLPKQHHRLESPRSRGVGTPRVCRPADYLPPGTVGQWPPATGQWWNERRGGDPKTDQRKEELSKQLGGEGRGPENPGVVAPLTFCKLSRQLLVGLNEHRWRRTKSTASSTSRWVTPPHDAHRSVGLGRFFAPPAHPGQHHHFAPHDEVEEQCVRSRFRTL